MPMQSRQRGPFDTWLAMVRQFIIVPVQDVWRELVKLCKRETDSATRRRDVPDERDRQA